jgi:hypothetical protein
VKGSCKLCGAVIETDPDPLMDEQREQRERTAFFNRVAYHIDPRNKICRSNFVDGRFRQAMQENGWFQRWRLLACLSDLDPKSAAKQEEWREYLHTITSKQVVDAIADIESKRFEDPPKVN